MPTKATAKKSKIAPKPKVRKKAKEKKAEKDAAPEASVLAADTGGLGNKVGSEQNNISEQTGADKDRVEKYYEAVGRRKEATARVRVFTKKSGDIQLSEDKALIIVNGKPYYEYFVLPTLQQVIESPLAKLKSVNRFKATVKVMGGGVSGQADAIKFGLSRALTLFDPNFSKKLKKAGFLTRDSRVKERRKYGLKKARKSPQWAKR